MPHQVKHGEYFKRGFKRHGINAIVTSDRDIDADIHVVSGNWYALDRWRDHDRVIWLDRCYYKGDPDHTSIGWLNKNGGRDFTIGSGRIAPTPKARRDRGGSIFLADYDGPIEQADTIRLHPARENHKEGLHDVLRRHAIAIGYTTTALVTAALEGLEVVCKDERNIMFQPNWLELLPYADWSNSEIESGEACQHLLSSLSQHQSQSR